MTRKRSRGLLPEEEQLWRRVADTATPMHTIGSRPSVRMPTENLAPVLARQVVPDGVKPDVAVQDAPFHIGQLGRTRRSDSALTERPGAPAVQMDRKSFDRMTRGKLLPEARLDLHGMTLAQAHPALTRFVMTAHADARRLVLVITGKGKRGDDSGPIPQRMGLLKHNVPQWLAMAPLGSLVLQVAEAHLKHGGTGAYYVYLRRQR